MEPQWNSMKAIAETFSCLELQKIFSFFKKIFKFTWCALLLFVTWAAWRKESAAPEDATLASDKSELHS